MSQHYPLIMENEVINVYCHMTMTETGNRETCGYGGWTLVMKIDGNKVSDVTIEVAYVKL